MPRAKYKTYQAKAVLNIHKHCDGGWFWNKYSAFPFTPGEEGTIEIFDDKIVITKKTTR